MRWFVDRRVSTEDELQERMNFYKKLTGREMIAGAGTKNCYDFQDRHDDNRCMIIGHTDAGKEVLLMLTETNKRKYKIYLSVCEMQVGQFEHWRKQLIQHKRLDWEIYFTRQGQLIVEGKQIQAVEFLAKNKTGLGFRATHSELIMFNSTRGFFNKLDAAFIRQR